MNIGSHEIGENNSCYIVAEIGINHNGSLDLARKLIDVSVDAGCDAVKFQKRTVDVVYSEKELTRPRDSPFGTTNGDLKRGLELDYDAYNEIDEYCGFKGIDWFASPWDLDSVVFLERFDIPCYKVASACITDLKLIDEIGLTGKPVILSTGMSTLKQIQEARMTVSGECALLSCTSTYPCKVEEINLAKITHLKNIFPEDVIGYSGHEVGLYTTLCAVAMGAKVIERHITLDRSMWGSDQAASLEPHGMKKLVEEIRTFEQALGTGGLGPTESEWPILEKLRRVK